MKEVSKDFIESFKDVSMVFQGKLKGVLREMIRGSLDLGPEVGG